MGTLKVNNIQSVTDGSVNFPQGSVSSQPVTFPSGTASNPSISFTGDTDTGLYRIDANKIGISTGGSKVGEISVGYGGFTGNVIQVVQVSDNTYTSVSSALYTWLTLTIVRKLPTSKILAIFSGNYATGNNIDTSVKLKNDISGYISIGNTAGIDNSSTSIGTDKGGTASLGGSGIYFMIPANINFLHTPTSTLSQTYSIEIWSESTQTLYPNGDGWRGSGVQSHNTQANLILMEIYS